MNVNAMKSKAKKAGKLMSALSNEKRLLILCQLVNGEHSVNQLAEALAVRQSTVSQHLALLRNDGFVKARRDAQTLYYSLAGNEARKLLQTLYQIYCTSPKPKARAAARGRS